MRSSNLLLAGGALLVAIALASVVLASYAPGFADVAKGIFFVTLTVFPAVVGVVFLGIGFADWLFGPTPSGHRHS